MHCSQFSKQAPEDHQLSLQDIRKSSVAELSTLVSAQEQATAQAHMKHVGRLRDTLVLLHHKYLSCTYINYPIHVATIG